MPQNEFWESSGRAERERDVEGGAKLAVKRMSVVAGNMARSPMYMISCDSDLTHIRNSIQLNLEDFCCHGNDL